jgi:hypothetical protein
LASIAKSSSAFSIASIHFVVLFLALDQAQRDMRER